MGASKSEHRVCKPVGQWFRRSSSFPPTSLPLMCGHLTGVCTITVCPLHALVLAFTRCLRAPYSLAHHTPTRRAAFPRLLHRRSRPARRWFLLPGLPFFCLPAVHVPAPLLIQLLMCAARPVLSPNDDLACSSNTCARAPPAARYALTCCQAGHRLATVHFYQRRRRGHGNNSASADKFASGLVC